MFLKCHCLRLSIDSLKDNCLILGVTRFVALLYFRFKYELIVIIHCHFESVGYYTAEKHVIQDFLIKISD